MAVPFEHGHLQQEDYRSWSLGPDSYLWADGNYRRTAHAMVDTRLSMLDFLKTADSAQKSSLLAWTAELPSIRSDIWLAASRTLWIDNLFIQLRFPNQIHSSKQSDSIRKWSPWLVHRMRQAQHSTISKRKGWPNSYFEAMLSQTQWRSLKLSPLAARIFPDIADSQPSHQHTIEDRLT